MIKVDDYNLKLNKLIFFLTNYFVEIIHLKVIK